MLLAAALPARADDPAGETPTADEVAAQRATIRELKLRLLWLPATRTVARRAEALKLAKRRRPAAGAGGARRRPSVDELEIGEARRLEAARAARPAEAIASIPANVRVNDPVSDITGAGQCEQYVASLGPNVLVAWNDGDGYRGVGLDTQGFATSSDGGVTWTDGGDPPHPGGAFTSWAWTSDPSVTVNEKTGDFYYCGLADADLVPTPVPGVPEYNAIAVARGHFSGGAFVWDQVGVVRLERYADVLLDKQWLVADSLSGNLYVCYTAIDFQVLPNISYIDLQRSTNQMASWSAPLKLSSALDNGRVQGARCAVGPGGEVVAAWKAIDQTTDEDNFRFRRSTNQGVSFAGEVNATKYMDNFGTGSPGFNRERGIGFASLAVDRTSGPHRGRVYLAWSECYDHLDESFPNPTPLNSRSEVENNNFASRANPFSAASSHILRGALASPYDADWWSFDLNAGQHVILWCDSLTADIGYSLRIQAPDPDSLQRLCFAGDLFPNDGTPLGAYYTFTAPVSGTYYVRVSNVGNSPANARYRIRTKLGTRMFERGRDQRDIFVATTDNGTAWSSPVRINDDAVGFSEFLPEVAVGSDGMPYALWFDYRGDAYGSRADVFASRSTDGGASWTANQRLTGATTNFTTVPVNLSPNMGDYNALAGDANRLHAAWSDGRDETVDVYTAAIETDHAITTCPNDTTMAPTGGAAFGWTLSNPNALFANTYSVSRTSQRAWGLPGTPTGVVIPAGGTAFFTQGIAVPDTAAAGVNRVCLTMTNANGTIAHQCCFDITVPAPLAVGEGGTAFALFAGAPNPSPGRVSLGFTLPRPGRATLRVYDLAGARVRSLVDGEQAAGAHLAVWDGRDDAGRAVPPGAYFARLESLGRSASRRIVFVR